MDIYLFIDNLIDFYMALPPISQVFFLNIFLFVANGLLILIMSEVEKVNANLKQKEVFKNER